MLNKVLAIAFIMPMIWPTASMAQMQINDNQVIGSSMQIASQAVIYIDTVYCINKLGDVNFDGQITLADAKLVLDHYFGRTKLYGCAFKAGDMNKDGALTPADASVIVKIYFSQCSNCKPLN